MFDLLRHKFMKLTRFAAYAWGVLGYNLLVILWGAYVRATGSGAGCGSHWPLCNGEVIPRAPEIKTIVEFTHRLSSGLALLSVVALVFLAFRYFPRRSAVRWGAALVGAGLVLFELVADNASIARALFMSVHLTNTFILVAWLSLTAWWASGGSTPCWQKPRWSSLLLAVNLIALVVLGVSGAVAALGDTLYPATSLQQALAQDFSPTAHVLIRLRIIHPFLAVATVFGLMIATTANLVFQPETWVKRLGVIVICLAVLQMPLGLMNIYLLAPIPLQLMHLLMADLIWITSILLTNSALSISRSTAVTTPDYATGAAVLSVK
jgi:heme A synthase